MGKLFQEWFRYCQKQSYYNLTTPTHYSMFLSIIPLDCNVTWDLIISWLSTTALSLTQNHYIPG